MKTTAYKICATAAILSAVTTLGIHAYFVGPNSLEEALQMYKTPLYIAGKWWVIMHCILVIISIYGLYYYLNLLKSPFALLGFTFYTAFGITEIFRMLMILEYISRLRDQYLMAEGLVQQMIKVSLDQMNGIGQMLFIGFTVFIILGNFFMGLSCLSGERIVHFIGKLLLVWSFVLIGSLANEYVQHPLATVFIHYFSLLFQPFIRIFLGVVLFRLARAQSRESTIPVTA